LTEPVRIIAALGSDELLQLLKGAESSCNHNSQNCAGSCISVYSGANAPNVSFADKHQGSGKIDLTLKKQLI
jgi:hypothetical protein